MSEEIYEEVFLKTKDLMKEYQPNLDVIRLSHAIMTSACAALLYCIHDKDLVEKTLRNALHCAVRILDKIENENKEDK